MDKLTGKAIIAMGGGPTAVINQSLVGAVLQFRRLPGTILKWWLGPPERE